MTFRRRALLLGGGAASTLLNGLTAYWAMQEASGSRADSVGSSTLADNATVTQNTGPGGGLVNAAEFLVATQNYLSVASNVNIQTLGGSFTIGGWFRYAGVNGGILGKAAATADYGLRLISGNVTFYVYDSTNASRSLSTVNPLTNGTWTAIRAWIDLVAQKIRIQYNTNAVEESAYTQIPRNSTDPLYFGRFVPSAGFLTGRLAGWGFWQRVLLDSEWAEFVNAGVPKAYPFR